MKNSSKIRLPIAFKLIFITITLLVAAAGAITVQSTQKFEDLAELRERDTNRDQSKARATEVESVLRSLIDKIRIVQSIMTSTEMDEAGRARALALAFGSDQDLVAVEIFTRDGQEPRRIVNENYLASYGLKSDYLDELRLAQRRLNLFSFAAVFAGQTEIRNSSLEGKAPLLTLGFPLMGEDEQVQAIVVGEIRLDRMQQVFRQIAERTMFLVDREGVLIAHPDEDKVMGRLNMAQSPVVAAALQSAVKQGEKEKYFDPIGKREVIGAYTKTALGVSVIAEVSRDIILEGARKVRREAFYTTGRVLSVALFLVFLFSISLTAPIERLVELTNEVARGNFGVRSRVRSRDEVGQLGRAFDQMLLGLIERDKVKNVLNKFHGSRVTEDLLKGDLQLGGSRKLVTVFFSDIRDFTRFSEGNTPEEVVKMLNEYFQIMVRIINEHGGVVDKFIGDAIMAVWGAPTAHERDAHNAVKACLEMRKALAELNAKRMARGQVEIRIGMGLHCGEAISGNIGSSERMEYTVIGDTVNQASRIESTTKNFGTDLLLSSDLANLVYDEFMIEDVGRVEVKGKAEPLTVFKVRGYINKDGQVVEVATPYSEYEPEADAKIKSA